MRRGLLLILKHRAGARGAGKEAMTTTRGTPPPIFTSSRYTIDLQNETVTLVLDPDTQETQTERLEDLIDSLMWLRRHEPELRRFVFQQWPPDNYGYQKMRLINGYYVGCSVEQVKGLTTRVNLHPVKVKASIFEDALKHIEHIVRRNWSEEVNEKRRDVIPIYDPLGKELYPERRQLVSEEETPEHLIYEAQARLWTPEYWLHTEANLEKGKPQKLP